MRKFILIFSSIIIIIFLSGCNFSKNEVQTQTVETPIDQLQYQKNLEDIIASPHVIGAISGRDLLIISPDSTNNLPIYQINDGQFPSTNLLDGTHFSKDHKFVIWYSPEHGVMYLDILNKNLKVIYKSTEFLNINPYMRFDDSTGQILFIDDHGNSLKIYNPESDQVLTVPIPYPYGNLFRISPAGDKILFVSGFGQDNDKPKYMITNIEGKLINQFTTKANISDRTLIDWAYNGNGLYAIVNNQLNYFSLDNLDSPQSKFSIPENQHVVKMNVINDRIFMLSDEDYWYVYSQIQYKELARTPTSIADELQHPIFLPISKNQFIISELMLGNDYEYHRLWLSDLFGQKHLLLKKFAQTKVIQQPLKVD